MHKGPTRSQHRSNTGATPEQYPSISRGSRWGQGPRKGFPPVPLRAKEKSPECEFDLRAISCLQIGCLKPEIPPVQRVFLAGEEGDLVEGDRVQRRGGVPGLAEGGFDRVLGDVEVDEEFGV